MRSVCALLASGLLLWAAPASGAEVCGDGQDNDSDSLADEGCYPTGVTGICESPLSCSRAGAVSPKTGNLVYRMPPDITPKVAYGPGIAFQRVYMAQYEPGYNFPSATDFKAPLGYQWQHNYMSWLEWTAGAGGSPDTVILHNTKGQDVYFEYDSTAGGYDYYVPQVGYHVDYLRQDTTTPYNWELRTLTGAVYKYDWDGGTDTGMLVAIQDSQATPNEVTIGYVGGQVDTVTDAMGEKWLKFEYSTADTKLLEYVKYYAGPDTGELRMTVKFEYTGENLEYVKYDTTTVQKYIYNGNDYLGRIEDEDLNDIASFTYHATNTDRIVRIETPDGDIGFEYGVGGGTDTYVYYHKASTSSCGTASCATGEYCGGETEAAGTPNTGMCYKMRRALTVTSANEDLIDGVSGPAGSDFNDAVDVETYSWDTGTSGDALALDGVKNAEDHWTSYARNSDGLVTKMVEGDDDANPDNTNPTGSRVTYYFYGDSDFPGLVTEVRVHSELKAAGSCDATTTTNCKRTIYTYDGDGQLSTLNEKGFTYNTSGTVVSYDYTTSYTYDTKGRITQVDGALSGTNDVTDYTYHTAGDLKQEYLKEIKRKKDASNYVTTTIDDYDSWGNATVIKDPDGTYTCRTYDSLYGYLSEEREAMNGQTSCATSHASDLVTQYARDSYNRLEQVTYPEGNCTFYDYDSEGRLTSIKPRDDCTKASSGQQISYTYDTAGDGLLIKVEYVDVSGATKKRQEYTHRASRRLKEAKNPVSTKVKTYAYNDDGQPASVTFESSDGKTAWTYDRLNRREDIRRYTDTSLGTYDTWDLTPGVYLDLPTQVLDDDSKDIDWVWDDLNRKVKQVTPDSNTTLYVYDAAGNRSDMVEADGLSGEVNHDYTYDNLGRILTADDDHIDCGVNQTEGEVEYIYDDALSECPASTACQSYDHTEGRLAYVRVTLWCDDTEGDDTIDQETFYNYDAAGRLIGEYIIDDTGREAEQVYEWDENGNATDIEAPSGVSMVLDRNPTGNSNHDRVKELSRLEPGSPTTIATAGDNYLPGGGPLTLLRQYNEVSSNDIYRSATYNLAYRPTEIRYYYSTTDIFEIDYTEDDRGRVTGRNFSHAHGSVEDAYYVYDELSRVTCDKPTTSSCPTSGSSVKTTLTGSPEYTASGERVAIAHDHSQWGVDTYTTTLESGKDRIDKIVAASHKAWHLTDYVWDDRGNRTKDDHNGMSYDARDYTYDGRGNLLTVRSKYYSGGTPVWYTMTAAYDQKNRRVFKSFLDENSLDEAHWFFYYDQFDRLIEIKHVPDIDVSSTYSIFQLYWIDHQPVAYWQIDYASGGGPTTTRRFWHTDELNRPLEVWSWPTSGNATRVWAINPDLFGWDDIVTGSSVYQPLRFPGQYFDEETVSWENSSNPARPALHYNWNRTYDPYSGTYLQVDPMVEDTWEAYNYVRQNPVGHVDRAGLEENTGGWLGELWKIIQGEQCFDDLVRGGLNCYWHLPSIHQCSCLQKVESDCEDCYAAAGYDTPPPGKCYAHSAGACNVGTGIAGPKPVDSSSDGRDVVAPFGVMSIDDTLEYRPLRLLEPVHR